MKIATNIIDIMIFDMTSSYRYLPAFLDIISSQESATADRFISSSHRQRYVTCRGMLRYQLAHYLDVAPQDICFTYGEHGKPYLVDHAITFNLSHTDDFAIYAFTATKPIGVDIESLSRKLDMDNIAQRFFAPSERDKIASVTGVDKTMAFFHCWTRKEAMLKAMGVGLSFPLEQLEVTVLPHEIPRVLQISGENLLASQWFLTSFMPADGYVAAVAVKAKGMDFNVQLLQPPFDL